MAQTEHAKKLLKAREKAAKSGLMAEKKEIQSILQMDISHQPKEERNK